MVLEGPSFVPYQAVLLVAQESYPVSRGSLGNQIPIPLKPKVSERIKKGEILIFLSMITSLQKYCLNFSMVVRLTLFGFYEDLNINQR